MKLKIQIFKDVKERWECSTGNGGRTSRKLILKKIKTVKVWQKLSSSTFSVLGKLTTMCNNLGSISSKNG